ncbi:MAG: polysaccharide deacetylase family protein [Gemmatimonadota bacterium]|nr:polysaccharide deacetylase family protein [Gemmatimonadota bacterium]
MTRVSPRRFERQVARLAEAGWQTAGIDTLLACARGEREPGDRELVLTFDDAYRGLRDHAFPVLEAHGFRAICSVITNYAGALNRWDVAYGGRRFAHLAWRDIRHWQDRGIEFISHSATHPRLTWLSAGDVAAELRRSRDALSAALGVPPRLVSYPFGAAADREEAIARSEGYEAGLVLARRWRGAVMAIPRLPVYLWSPPTPGVGPLAAVEWLAAVGANRCAVGTAIWRAARAHRYTKYLATTGSRVG